MSMTIEQAIRILDPETTAEALAEIEYYNGFSGQTAKVQACSEACEVAVAAMRDSLAKKTLSNADRIRAMTDEELAVLLNGTCVCDCCVNGGGGCVEAFNMSKCLKGTIEWLKQPAQEVAHEQT